MKRALTIVAVVTAYTLFEAVLLMSLSLPFLGLPPTTYWLTVTFAQLLLIPGFTVLYSWATFGKYESLRQLILTLTVAALCVPVVSLPFILSGLLFLWVEPESAAGPVLVLLLVLCGVLYGVFRFVQFMRQRGVRIEAERWLAERQSGVTSNERRLQNRAIRWSLWIPSLTVLLVFLFFTEIWGAMSHTAYRGTSKIGKHRVHIPLTWFIYPTDSDHGVSGITLLGPGRGYRHYPLRQAFGWGFNSISEQEAKERGDYPLFLNKDAWRGFSIGDEFVTCEEERVHRKYSTHWREFTSVRCSGSEGLRASFSGEADQKEEFYRVLERIRLAK